MKINNCAIELIQADITGLEVDAIVNAANNKLVMGGGVAVAIKKKGGEVIEEEAVAKGPIDIGAAVYTSAGKLPAKFVIHTATMGMDFSRPTKKSSGIPPPAGKTDEYKIRQSCASSLKIAEELKIESIAFPALGCGTGGFAYVACAKIMAQEVFKHLREFSASSLRRLVFCLYSKEAFDVFNQAVIKYLEHITKKIMQGPFITVDVIIEINGGIVLIKRSNPPFGWALPGGFVDYGESLEEAAAREAKEETNLDLEDLRQLHTYSTPRRDPRFHTISCVFIARGKGKPQSGSDAAGLSIVKLSEIKNYNLAFDHKEIIEDYLKYK